MRLREDKIDGSKDMAAQFNALKDGIALRARHPVRFADNAFSQLLANPLPFEASTFLESVGSWHQKFQVVRRSPDALGNRVIGYVGGIDMNRNRVDSPGHHGRAWQPPGPSSTPSPRAFHDVHARVTGPAAADVALTFAHRWAFDASRQPPGVPRLDLAFATPAATDTNEVPPQAARHLVQVGRSGFAPRLTSGAVPLPLRRASASRFVSLCARTIGMGISYEVSYVA